MCTVRARATHQRWHKIQSSFEFLKIQINVSDKKSWIEKTPAKVEVKSQIVRITTILVAPYIKLENGIVFSKNRSYTIDELDGYW